VIFEEGCISQSADLTFIWCPQFSQKWLWKPNYALITNTPGVMEKAVPCLEKFCKLVFLIELFHK
jgi:hypothetical protein